MDIKGGEGWALFKEKYVWKHIKQNVSQVLLLKTELQWGITALITTDPKQL